MIDLCDAEQDARSEARYEETDFDRMSEEAERRRWDAVEANRETERS